MPVCLKEVKTAAVAARLMMQPTRLSPTHDQPRPRTACPYPRTSLKRRGREENSGEAEEFSIAFAYAKARREKEKVRDVRYTSGKERERGYTSVQPPLLLARLHRHSKGEPGIAAA